MPRVDLWLSKEAQMGHEIVGSGERAALTTRADWSPRKLEFLYELAFLRLFSAWESALESIFLRSLCGYASTAGPETLIIGSHHPTLYAAETAVLASESRPGLTRTYLLWHSTSTIIARCQRHLVARAAGTPPIQQGIIASNQARLDSWAAVRHRIVHNQSDSKAKFDRASLMFSGVTYPHSRPGKFLRDVNATRTPPIKWLDTAIQELTGLTRQMV
jgi:hypothetical protein